MEGSPRGNAAAEIKGEPWLGSLVGRWAGLEYGESPQSLVESGDSLACIWGAEDGAEAGTAQEGEAPASM